jgi:hypothetical protein
MKFKENYKALKKSTLIEGEYSIIPLRYDDRIHIMEWRNQQLFHLRQIAPLTIQNQDIYFENVIAKLFEQANPSQILFSFLKNEICIGYGGLVHINWIDKNAEISFIMNTKLEKEYFEKNWNIFLDFIQKVAFDDLKLHKISTYAFDLRPNLYKIFENKGFFKDAILRDQIFHNELYINVVIHSKINNDD